MGREGSDRVNDFARLFVTNHGQFLLTKTELETDEGYQSYCLSLRYAIRSPLPGAEAVIQTHLNFGTEEGDEEARDEAFIAYTQEHADKRAERGTRV